MPFMVWTQLAHYVSTVGFLILGENPIINTNVKNKVHDNLFVDFNQKKVPMFISFSYGYDCFGNTVSGIRFKSSTTFKRANLNTY